MDPTFGARLRLHRERQQIALSAIAEDTKIKLSLLDGLEHDDLSHWPQGIFRRSYVRAYAKAIGLDPDGTVREFLELYPDSDEDIQSALVRAQPNGGDTRRRPPTRLRFLIGSALNALPSRHPQPGQKADSDRSLPPDRGVPKEAAQPRLELESVPDFDVAPAPEPAPVVSSMVEEAPAELETAQAGPSTVACADAPVATDNASAGHRHCGVDFSALADLCTRLGRALEVGEVTPALRDAVGALGAVGLILWIPDPHGNGLLPAIAHGYSDEVLAHLPRVPGHTDNAIASAFRSVETRVVTGSESATGALVVPLSAPTRCTGVLALEFRHGAEQHACVRAFATILAAQLSTLFESPTLAQAVNA